MRVLSPLEINAPKGTRNKSLGVQLLRGLAAFMVVITHLQIGLASSVPEDFISSSATWAILNYGHIGDYGVDLFFLISGFVIYKTAISDKANVDWKSFSLKRIIRIVPLYWLLTSFVAILAVATPFLKTYQFSWRTFLSSLFFIPWVPASGGICKAVLYLGWTLNFEMMFYLYAAAVLIFFRKNKMLVLTGVIGAGLVITRSLTSDETCYISGSYYVIDFIAGALIAASCSNLFSCNKKYLELLAWISAFGFFSMIALIDYNNPLKMIIPSVVLIVVALSTRIESPLVERIANFLGDTSYPLYLIHPFIVRAFELIIQKKHFFSAHPIVGIVFVILLAYIAASVLNIYYDKPARTFLSNYLDINKTKI